MRFWTLTDRDCWRTAVHQGYLGNSKTYVDPDMADAYQWMHDRFVERCTRIESYTDADSLVWCRKAHADDLIKLKPVSDAADESVLVWLEVKDDHVTLTIEVLEDFAEITSTYHNITLGPVKVHIWEDGDDARVIFDTQQNPALAKLCLSIPTQAELDGDFVHVRILAIEKLYHHPEWDTHVLCNGQERASWSYSKICERRHNVLVECEVPETHVLVSSEQNFTWILNNFANQKHRCFKWDATASDVESDDVEIFIDAPAETCLENYRQIFDVDETSIWNSTHDYDIQGVVERLPMSWITSVWHTVDDESHL